MNDATYGPPDAPRQDAETPVEAPVAETPDPEVAQMMAEQSESQAPLATLGGGETVGRDSPLMRAATDPPGGAMRGTDEYTGETPGESADAMEQRAIDANAAMLRERRKAVRDRLDNATTQDELNAATEDIRDIQRLERRQRERLERRFDRAEGAVKQWVTMSQSLAFKNQMQRDWTNDATLLGTMPADTPVNDLDLFLKNYVEGNWLTNIIGGAARGVADVLPRINDAIITGYANFTQTPFNSFGLGRIELPERGLTTRPADLPDSVLGSLSYGFSTYAAAFIGGGMTGLGTVGSLTAAAVLDYLFWNPFTEGSMGTGVREVAAHYQREFANGKVPDQNAGFFERQMYAAYQSGALQSSIDALGAVSADLIAEQHGEHAGRMVNLIEGTVFNFVLLGAGAAGRSLARQWTRGAQVLPEMRAQRALSELGEAAADPDLMVRATGAIDDLRRSLIEVQLGVGDQQVPRSGPGSLDEILRNQSLPVVDRVNLAAEQVADYIRKALQRGDPGAEGALAARFGDDGLSRPALLQWAARIDESQAIRSAFELNAFIAMRQAAQHELMSQAADRNMRLSRTPSQNYTLENADAISRRMQTEVDNARSRADASTLSQGGDELTRQRPAEFAGEFREGLAATARDHKFGFAVELKDLPFYQDPSVRMFAANDGSVGVAVTPAGDVVSVFRHPDATQSVDPAIRAAIRDGGVTLDAFDINGVLPSLYGRHDMRPVARVAWNDDYAPPGWNYDIAGRPDVLLMVHDPAGVTGLPAVPGREAGGYAAIREQVPLFSDWNDAVAARRPAMQAIGAEGRVGASVSTRTNFQSRSLSPEDILEVERRLGSMDLGIDRLHGYEREHIYAVLTEPMFGFMHSSADARAIANAVTSGFGLDSLKIRGAIPDIGVPHQMSRVLFQRNDPFDSVGRHVGKRGEMTQSIADTTAPDLDEIGARLVLRQPGVDTDLKSVRGSNYAELPSVAEGGAPQASAAFTRTPFTDADLDGIFRQTLDEMVRDGVMNLPGDMDPTTAFRGWVDKDAKFRIKIPDKKENDARDFWVGTFGKGGSRWEEALAKTGLNIADGMPLDFAKRALDEGWLGRDAAAVANAKAIVQHITEAGNRQSPFQIPPAKFWNQALTEPGNDRFRFWYEIGSERLFGGDYPMFRFDGDSAAANQNMIRLAGIIAETSPRTQVDTNLLNALGAYGALTAGEFPRSPMLFPQKIAEASTGSRNMRFDATNYKVTNFNLGITSTLPQSRRPSGAGIGAAYDSDLPVMDVVMAGLFRVSDEAWTSYSMYDFASRFIRRARNEINRRMEDHWKTLSPEEQARVGPYDPFESRQVQALLWTYWNSIGGKKNPDSTIKKLWEEYVGNGQTMSQRAVDYPDTMRQIIDIARRHPRLKHHYEGPNAKVYRNGDAYLDNDVVTDPEFWAVFFPKAASQADSPTMITRVSDMGLQYGVDEMGQPLFRDPNAMASIPPNPRDEAIGRLSSAIERIQEGSFFDRLRGFGVSEAAIDNALKSLRRLLTGTKPAGIIEMWRRVVRSRKLPAGPRGETGEGSKALGAEVIRSVLNRRRDDMTMAAANYSGKVEPYNFGGQPGDNPNRLRADTSAEWSSFEGAGGLGQQFGDWQMTGPFGLRPEGGDPAASLSFVMPSNFDEVRIAVAAIVEASGIPQRVVRYGRNRSKVDLDNPLTRVESEENTVVRVVMNKVVGTGDGANWRWTEITDALPDSAAKGDIDAQTSVGMTELFIPGRSKQQIVDSLAAKRDRFNISKMEIVDIDPRSFTMGIDEATSMIQSWQRTTLGIESSDRFWKGVSNISNRWVVDHISEATRREFLAPGSTKTASQAARDTLRNSRLDEIVRSTFGTQPNKVLAAFANGEIRSPGRFVAYAAGDMDAASIRSFRKSLMDTYGFTEKQVDAALKKIDSIAADMTSVFDKALTNSSVVSHSRYSGLMRDATEGLRDEAVFASKIVEAMDRMNDEVGLKRTLTEKGNPTQRTQAIDDAVSRGEIERSPSVLFQNDEFGTARGAIWDPDAGGITFIKGFTAADRTTGAHELAHALVIQAESRGGQTGAIGKREWSSVRDYFGAKDGKWDRVAHERFADVFAEALTSKTLPGDMPDDVVRMFLRGMAEIRDLGLDYKSSQKTIMASAAFQQMLRDMESLPLPIRIGRNKYANGVDWGDLIEHAKTIRANGDKWQDVIDPGDVLAHARIFQSDRYPGMIMHRDHLTGRISFVKSFWTGYDEKLRKEMRRNTHFHRATREEMFETMAFFEDFVRAMRNEDPIIARQPLADAREGGLVLFARLMNQPDGEVHNMLNKMMQIDLSTDQLSDRVIGARLFMMFQLDETLKMAKKARESGDVVDYAVLQREFLVFQQAQHHVAQLMSQSGRALRAMRDPARLPSRKELSDIRKTDEFWEQLGRDQRVGPELAEMLDGLKLPEHAALASAIINGTNAAGPVPRVAGIAQEVYVNALLSAPRTFVGLTTGAPFMMTLIESVEHFAGALARQDGQQLRAVFRDLRQKWQDLGVSLRYAVKAFQDEAPRFMEMRPDRAVGLDDSAANATRGGKAITAENVGLKDDDLGGWLVNMTGKAVRFPTRVIMATDEFFRQLNGRNAIYAKAYDDFMASTLKDAKETGLVVTRTDEAEFRRFSRPQAERHAEAEVDRMVRDGQLRDRHRVYAESLQTDAVRNAPTPYHKAMEVIRYMEENFTHRSASMVKQAEDYATRATMQGRLERGSPAKMIQNAVDQFPLGRVIVPFYRTPVQIFRRFGGWSPTTLLAEGAERLMQRAFNGSWKLSEQRHIQGIHNWHMEAMTSGDPRRIAEARGRQAFGLGLVSLASYLAYEGLITGAGPKDRDHRSIWLQNNQPYSLRIGDSWVSFQKMAPVGQYFGLMADAMELLAAEEFRGGINGEKQDLVNGLIYALGQQVRNMPMLQGVTTIMDALERNDAFGATLMRNTLTAATPFSSGQRAVNQVTDGVVYEVRSLLDAYRVRTWFGDASKVAPARTPLGETLTVYPEGNTWQPWVNLVNPMMFVTNSPDPVYRTINEIGMYLSMPDPVTDGVDYSNIPVPGYEHSAYDWWMEKISTTVDKNGKTLRNVLESFILPSGENHSEWLALMAGQSAPPVTGEDTPAARVIRSVVGAYQRIAYFDMLEASPEAMRLWEEARSARVESYEAVQRAQAEQDRQARPADRPNPLAEAGTVQIFDRIREAAR